MSDYQNFLTIRKIQLYCSTAKEKQKYLRALMSKKCHSRPLAKISAPAKQALGQIDGFRRCSNQGRLSG